MDITSQAPSIGSTYLKVSEVPFKDWDSISEITQKWASIAQEKEIKTQKTGDDIIFADSKFVIQKIQEKIETSLALSESVADASLFVCLDHTSTVQGIAFFSPQKLDIIYLASNPNHLLHRINDAAKRVHGVGTAMILHFAQIAQSQDKPLKVFPLPSSFPFYNQLGFVEGSMKWDLVLTCEKIQDLISRKL